MARCPMVDEIRMAFIISQNISAPFSGCLWGMIEILSDMMPLVELEIYKAA